MEITTSTVQGRAPVTVLHLKGDLDASTIDVFTAVANQAVEGGAHDILVDMAGTPFMSSAGIRALHNLYTLLHPSGTQADQDAIYQAINAGTYSAPHLKLLKPTKKVEDVIRLAGLDMYLTIYTSPEEAVASF
jgi:anti-anti-sigma factor